MALSPFDVEHKTFRTALRGYAEDEVDEFLDEVVASLREFEQKLRDATEMAGVLESELAASRETETAIKRTFIAAQRTADQIIEEAREEASRLSADARAEAARYETERATEREKATNDIEAMRTAVEDLKKRLAQFADQAWDEAETIDAAIGETAATFGLPEDDEEPTFEMPSFDEAGLDEEIEYYDDDTSAEAEETAGLGDDLPVEDEEGEDKEEELVDAVGSDQQPAEEVDEPDEGQALLRRPRPTRPWERDD